MEEKNKEMEESIIEWANFKFEVENKEKWDIVFNGLENNKKASDLLVHLINDVQNTFFKLGKQVARIENIEMGAENNGNDEKE
ncbi:hypothetical protein AB8B22_02345 [Leptotrichia sp. HSP-334]|uniref:Uncharacterized protein n=1 Tax=Leptotrichia rugosa TaxID=3239302 RepID=A0AB39VJE0_9FUSO